MYKYTEKSQKCQEGVFTSYEIKRKFNIDFLTASLYGQIKYWATNKEGYCFASNEQFADIFDVSQTQIKRMISNLIEVGLITRVMEKNYKRKLFIIEMNEPDHTEQPPTHTEQPPTHTGLPLDHTGLHKIESKLENKLENKLESNNINYNMQNFDLVEDMEGVDNNTSTIPPSVGDDIDLYLASIEEEPFDNRFNNFKNKPSTKEESDYPQRDFDSKFTDDEKLNALDYE